MLYMPYIYVKNYINIRYLKVNQAMDYYSGIILAENNEPMIWYASIFRVTVHCELQESIMKFPFDKHTCNLEFDSTDSIRAKDLVELDEFVGVGSNHDDKNSVSGFTITKERKYFSNTSAVFGVEFQFETNIVGYLIRYYLICGILVSLISAISFMIKPSIVPGRIGLLITIFLVLASFFSLAQVLILFIHKTH